MFPNCNLALQASVVDDLKSKYGKGPAQALLCLAEPAVYLHTLKLDVSISAVVILALAACLIASAACPEVIIVHAGKKKQKSKGGKDEFEPVMEGELVNMDIDQWPEHAPFAPEDAVWPSPGEQQIDPQMVTTLL